jgi:thiamine biosynthesis lipoprotein
VAAGARSFFIDAGGDVLARGGREGGPWRIGIRHPREKDQVACVLAATDLAVATSGVYEKGEHIVDPHTGTSAHELLSLTVTGPDIVEADVLATAAFAISKRGLELVASRPPYEAYMIHGELIATWTSGFGELRSY